MYCGVGVIPPNHPPFNFCITLRCILVLQRYYLALYYNVLYCAETWTVGPSPGPWRQNWMSSNTGWCLRLTLRVPFAAHMRHQLGNLSASGPGSSIRDRPKQETPAIQPRRAVWRRAEKIESNECWSAEKLLEEARILYAADMGEMGYAYGRPAPPDRLIQHRLEKRATQRPLAPRHGNGNAPHAFDDGVVTLLYCIAL